MALEEAGQLFDGFAFASLFDGLLGPLERPLFYVVDPVILAYDKGASVLFALVPIITPAATQDLLTGVTQGRLAPDSHRSTHALFYALAGLGHEVALATLEPNEYMFRALELLDDPTNIVIKTPDWGVAHLIVGVVYSLRVNHENLVRYHLAQAMTYLPFDDFRLAYMLCAEILHNTTPWTLAQLPVLEVLEGGGANPELTMRLLFSLWSLVEESCGVERPSALVEGLAAVLRGVRNAFSAHVLTSVPCDVYLALLHFTGTPCFLDASTARAVLESALETAISYPGLLEGALWRPMLHVGLGLMQRVDTQYVFNTIITLYRSHFGEESFRPFPTPCNHYICHFLALKFPLPALPELQPMDLDGWSETSSLDGSLVGEDVMGALVGIGFSGEFGVAGAGGAMGSVFAVASAAAAACAQPIDHTSPTDRVGCLIDVLESDTMKQV